MGTGSIFISYRRSDVQQPARGLYERLKLEFGPSAVFYDGESIDIGTHFPSALQLAIGRARVVLAVVGNGWQQSLIDNHKKLDEIDYVREELKQASARVEKGDALLLMPVLIGSTTDFNPAKLPTALQTDLAHLLPVNALTLTHGSWDIEIKGLVERIRKFEKDHPGPHKSHGQRVEDVHRELVHCLANPVLVALAKNWLPKLEELQKLDAASEQICELQYALTAALRELSAAAQDSNVASPKTLCLQITALLASLAVDADAARAELDRSGTVPSNNSAVAALVRAVALGQRMALLPDLASSLPQPDRTAIANVALDAGVGEPWTMDIAAQFWNQLHPADMRSADDSRLWRDLGVLAAKLKQRARREGMPFFVLSEADFKNRDAVHAAAQRLNAEPLLVAAAPPGTQPVLTEPEVELVAAMSDCIHVIGKLP